MLIRFRKTASRVCLLAFVFALSVSVFSQTPKENVTLKVTVVDQNLNLKNVPKFALVVRKMNDAAFAEQRVATTFEGAATLTLPAGDYTVRSEKPLEFEGKSFVWEQSFKVADGQQPVTVELSNDNAKISAISIEANSSSAAAASSSASPRRRVSEEGELFKILRDGVVTVEGETGSGTGFVIDERGLILTNQHVVGKSNEIRVRFDKQTAVKARVLAEDAARDIAVLQVNLSACAVCRPLKIAAANKPEEPTVVEGERVFAIGSPLYQDKILTSGIVSKVEARAIISDVNINPGNSGGPLFNSIGEVVGLTTFGVQSDGGGGPGIAGIVRIEEAAAVLKQAREKSADLSLPSAELMPNMPDGAFPVETIKTRIDVKKFERKPYKDDIKNYQINYMTPVYKFYISEKDRLESQRDRNKRNKDKGAQNTIDRFRDLRNWNEYAGELRPVVDILALPEVTASGNSMLLSILTSATVGIPTPLNYKFKADFYQMKLMCDGREVTPLKRTKVEFGAQMPSYYKVKTRYTYAGVYTYPFDTFEPGKCAQLQLHVFSEENIETPIVTNVAPLTKDRIWNDFDEYRRQAVKP